MPTDEVVKVVDETVVCQTKLAFVRDHTLATEGQSGSAIAAAGLQRAEVAERSQPRSHDLQLGHDATAEELAQRLSGGEHHSAVQVMDSVHSMLLVLSTTALVG